MMKQYIGQLTESAAARTVEWVKTLPWRDGIIDLEVLDLTMDEFLKIGREMIPMPSSEQALEEFLRQATDSQ